VADLEKGLVTKPYALAQVLDSIGTVTGDPVDNAWYSCPESSINPEAKSVILGDWLRKDYIAVGFADPAQVSRRRFDEMGIGDFSRVRIAWNWCLGSDRLGLWERHAPHRLKLRHSPGTHGRQKHPTILKSSSCM
jgi:hypothetical protein